MSTYRFEALLAPRAIAVAGLDGPLGQAVFDNLGRAGFAGPVWRVGPSGFPTFADLPEAPDLAAIVSDAADLSGWVE